MFDILYAIVTLGSGDREVKELPQTHEASKRATNTYNPDYNFCFSLMGLKRELKE